MTKSSPPNLVANMLQLHFLSEHSKAVKDPISRGMRDLAVALSESQAKVYRNSEIAALASVLYNRARGDSRGVPSEDFELYCSFMDEVLRLLNAASLRARKGSRIRLLGDFAHRLEFGFTRLKEMQSRLTPLHPLLQAHVHHVFLSYDRKDDFLELLTLRNRFFLNPEPEHVRAYLEFMENFELKPPNSILLDGDAFTRNRATELELRSALEAQLLLGEL